MCLYANYTDICAKFISAYSFPTRTQSKIHGWLFRLVKVNKANGQHSIHSVENQLKEVSFHSSGKNLSSVQFKNIESQAVLLPDIQGDSVPDLLIATLPADEVRLHLYADVHATITTFL